MTADSTTPGTSRRTPLAILMALVLVLPGMLLGGLAGLVYFALMTGWDEGSRWSPFLDGIFKFIWIDMMPEVIRGAVAIAVSLGLTFLAFKRADHAVVTYAVFPVYIIIGLILTGPYWYRLSALMLGFVVGAFPIKLAVRHNTKPAGHARPRARAD